jgi:exonuclease VII small subunit
MSSRKSFSEVLLEKLVEKLERSMIQLNKAVSELRRFVEARKE